MVPLLSVSRVSKNFGAHAALKDVSFSLDTGECLALVGENGAGKSTLMKILSGVWPSGSHSGEIRLGGERIHLESTLDARLRGISIIHQELCLFPKLTVAENIFLTEAAPYDGQPSTHLAATVNWDLLFSRAEALFKDLGFALNPYALVESLGVAQKQLVEIARAFHHKAKVLILDEPTSALSPEEAQSLFAIIERLKGKCAFIYISHKLDEVFRLADRIAVLRDGQSVAELDPKHCSTEDLVYHMVGRKVQIDPPQQTARSEKLILKIENLNHMNHQGKKILSDIHFEVGESEIVGIAGLMGSGRSELLRSLLGTQPGSRQAKIEFCGRKVEWDGARDALDHGVGYVPEDRKKEGLFLDLSVGFNFSISVLKQFISKLGILDLHSEERAWQDWGSALRVRYPALSTPIRNLSGGNQQKVILGRLIAQKPKLVLLDEPTRGIDIGAKQEIYQIIRDLCARGISVVLVSSELPELLSLCHRILVLREGKLVANLPNENLNQETILKHATAATTREARCN